LFVALAVWVWNFDLVNAKRRVKATVGYPCPDRCQTTPTSVKLTIKNRGRKAVEILRWLTVDAPGAFDDIEADIFRVTLNGELVDYLGPQIKRAAPTREDYLTIKPGKSIVKTVDLSKFYDMSKPGEYRAKYKVVNDYLFSVKGKGKGKLTSNTYTIYVDP
jgi:peptidyl-Lys metalloendopeptidase